MDNANLIATAEVNISAPVYKVWEALIDPESIKKYMFGTTVESDFKVGSDIVWKGEWNGHPYEDRGKILKVIPGKTLQYSHISPGSGEEDVPENYRTVTIELSDVNDKTHVLLTQDKNATDEARNEAQKNWNNMLDSMRALLEE